MQKISRLLAIERIIRDEEISSQDELMKRLNREGIICTQATLSRNLRQMGVFRVPGIKGSYRYSLPGNGGNENQTGMSFTILSVIRLIIDANSMIVIKTRPGHANSVAVVIDSAERYEIAGTIAGDDTLLVIPRDNIGLQHIHSCLEMIIPGLHKSVKKG
jgi:transcriptional regulator of arginine metabolism